MRAPRVRAVAPAPTRKDKRKAARKHKKERASQFFAHRKKGVQAAVKEAKSGG